MKGLLVLLVGVAGIILLLTPWNVGLGYAGVIGWTGLLLYLTLIRPDPVARALSSLAAATPENEEGNGKEGVGQDGAVRGVSEHSHEERRAFP